MAQVNFSRAVQALKDGDRLMVTNPDPSKSGDIRRFHLIGLGAAIPSRTFEKIRGDLTPLGDGLFPSEPSQTFGWGGE